MLINFRSKWVWIILFCFVCMQSYADLNMDESASIKWSSKTTLVSWPNNSFFNYIKAKQNKVLGQVNVKDLDKARSIEVPLKGLKIKDKIHLLLYSGKGVMEFFSKETKGSNSPRLLIKIGMENVYIPVAVDTYLHKSTISALGNRSTFKAGKGHYGLLSFNVPADLIDVIPDKAKLLLYLTNMQYGNAVL